MPKILICMKQVVASDAKVKITGDQVDEANVELVVNPYDEYAAEAALQLGWDATVVSLGPDKVQKALKSVLALGVAEAVQIWGSEFEGGDVLATARALAAAAKKIEPDLILCGKQAIDQDNHQLGALLSEFLGWPHLTAVTGLEINEGGTCTGKREIEGGQEQWEFTLPAVVTCDKGLNEPRYASLKGIMKVKKIKIPVWGIGDLGVEAGAVGAAGAGTKILSQELPPARQAGKVLEGEPADVAKQVVKLLREEAKVI
jgi:electron transfer flavoprotein beta subunit